MHILLAYIPYSHLLWYNESPFITHRWGLYHHIFVYRGTELSWRKVLWI